jgi:hypothetical protein
VSRGQEAIAALQEVFGQPVEPVAAVMLMKRKIEEQDQRLEFLKNLVTAIAFDRGQLGWLAPLGVHHHAQCMYGISQTCDCGTLVLEQFLALENAALAEKTVTIMPAPRPGRIITG